MTIGEYVIPLDLLSYLTLPGVIVLAALVGLWARNALAEWRWTPWVVLAACEAIVILLRYIVSAWTPTSQEVALAALLCFIGVSIETYGYEGILNALGVAGIGRRSEATQLDNARTLIAENKL